jgi:Trp operon repressor
MISRPDELAAAMRELLDAHEGGRREMDRADRLLRVGIGRLESGKDFEATIAGLPTVDERQAMEDAFKRIIDARHELRLQILAVCLDKGLRPREIGERWGVSRQRVAKYKAELKERQVEADPAPPAPYVHVSTIRGLPG